MVRMYLITANVGSVFDNLEEGLPVWLNEFSSVVRSRDPEFLAIHFQETGGKSCDDASDAIKEFFRQLVDQMEQLDFRVAEGFVDSTSNVEDQFTALSSIYFVHESLRLPVHIWDFQDGKFQEVTRSKAPSSTEVHPNIHMGPRLNKTNRKQKEKFPQNFYPNCKWSRKGFLRTRWRFARTTVDLVNIHLFHDSCNLMAASVFPSQFAQHREKTIMYTLDRIQSDGLEKSPLFIFGDFNFRVNAFGVMEILRKDFGDPVSKLCEENSLVIGAKKFHCPEQESRFKDSFEWLKQYDFEPKKFATLLQEQDLNFHPTYPFSEELNEPEKYMRTRLPAWCDRVLFTPSTRDIFVKDFPIDYNLIGSKVCMGDHKPVGLCLKIQTSDYPHPPRTLNSINKGDSGTTSRIDASNNTINKGNSPVSMMTELILELSKSSPTSLPSVTMMVSGGTLPKTTMTCVAAASSAITAIVENDDNLDAISSTSHTLQNGCNYNLSNLDGDGLMNKSVFKMNSGEMISISSLSRPGENKVTCQEDDLDAIESEFESPRSIAGKSNCFFGALFRCRGKKRFSHGNGIASSNGGGIGISAHSNGCKNALNGLKSISKYKRGGGGGGGSSSRSGSLLEPIANAGCDFPCSSLPSSGLSSQRVSVTGSISTTAQSDTFHFDANKKVTKRSKYFPNFFTASSNSNGKVKQSKDCHHRGKCSRCCRICCGVISQNREENAATTPLSTDCHCQNNRLMLNLATMITNSCSSINNSRNNINNGELSPLGSSNLSLIALNSNTDTDKQTFVDGNGKMIENCCNENMGKIPVCWATTTTPATYNNGNNKLSSSCANCSNNGNKVNKKNLHNINNCSSHPHPNYLNGSVVGGEKNTISCNKSQNNGLAFNLRGRSASQGSASIPARCKCQIKESMNRTSGGCGSCSKCVIL